MKGILESNWQSKWLFFFGDYHIQLKTILLSSADLNNILFCYNSFDNIQYIFDHEFKTIIFYSEKIMMINLF